MKLVFQTAYSGSISWWPKQMYDNPPLAVCLFHIDN